MKRRILENYRVQTKYGEAAILGNPPRDVQNMILPDEIEIINAGVVNKPKVESKKVGDK